MCDVHQRFDSTTVEDISATVHQQLRKLNLQHVVKHGETVAVTAGSRGIANIVTFCGNQFCT